MARLKHDDDFSINSDIVDTTEGQPYMAYVVEEIAGKKLGVFADHPEALKCAQMAVNPTLGGYGDVAIRGESFYSLPFFKSAVDWLIA